MAFIDCPECRREIDADSESCPECGHKIAEGEAAARKTIIEEADYRGIYIFIMVGGIPIMILGVIGLIIGVVLFVTGVSLLFRPQPADCPHCGVRIKTFVGNRHFKCPECSKWIRRRRGRLETIQGESGDSGWFFGWPR